MREEIPRKLQKEEKLQQIQQLQQNIIEALLKNIKIETKYIQEYKSTEALTHNLPVLIGHLVEYLECEKNPKQAYKTTKDFLENNRDILTSEQKCEIFQKYVKEWKSKKFYLHIKETEYAELYKKIHGKVGLLYPLYTDSCVMIAGFNLNRARLGSITDFSEMTFVAINFEGSNIPNKGLLARTFTHCNFSEVIADETNFSKSTFHQCNLNKSDLSKAFLSEVRFYECDVRGTRLNQKYNTHGCGFDFTDSICDNNTTGLSESTLKSANIPGPYKLQNVDNKEVMAYWEKKANEGKEVPHPIVKVLAEKAVAERHVLFTSLLSLKDTELPTELQYYIISNMLPMGGYKKPIVGENTARLANKAGQNNIAK
jgi:hypothetical protein